MKQPIKKSGLGSFEFGYKRCPFNPGYKNTDPSDTRIMAELTRELQMRLKVYPQWIQQGKIAPGEAEHRSRCLELAIEKLGKHFEGCLQTSLFSDDEVKKAPVHESNNSITSNWATR